MTLRELLINAYLWAHALALALLLAPLACVVASVLGIHRVSPLSELASVRTLCELAGFSLACIALLLRVLYRRAVGRRG